MSEARSLNRLWRFVEDSLGPHRDIGVASLSKEKEREILLALSKVFRQVQLLNQEFDSVPATRLDSESEFGSNSEEIQCLFKITLDLVCLMIVDSRFVQHLAGNVLVVVSEFVVENGRSNWKAFMRFLCVFVDSAINILLSRSPIVSYSEDEDEDEDVDEDEDEDEDEINSSFVFALKDKLRNIGWSVVGGMIRVLRSILKNLVVDDGYDDWTMSVYFESVFDCLSNLPWDSFDEVFGALDYEAPKRSLERFTFLGNIVQLLCSFTEHIGAVEDFGGSHRPFSFIIALIPKMLNWGPSKRGGTQYLRHKILVLMIRISFQTSLDCSVLVLWLQLLQEYFGEILRQPITSLESVQSDSLEGSPFLMSFSDDEKSSLSSLHVQRRVIFLFLRCCLNLVNTKSGTSVKCACATQRSLLNDSIAESECCGRKRSLIELNNWIRWQLSSDFFPNSEIYLQKCVNFSLAFLQLYIHEDDLLFRMLLQLLCLPVPAKEELKIGKFDFQEAGNDVLFHVSNLFNHVHLFHLFLAELHYDHQVLLDYLISKDIGTSCAEYLLRCLRIVCDSWHLFLEFSVDQKRVDKSSLKKRKHISECQDESCVPVENDKPLTVEYNEGYQHDTEKSQPLGKAYREANDCLLSLLVSIESLNQKKLFPYNPNVLLKRFRAFQKLCSKM